MVQDSVTAAASRRLPWTLFAGASALAAWASWQAWGPQDLGDPLATSLAAFEQQNRLTVFSAQLSPVVASDDERLFGVLKTRQVAVIPARVEYTLDLDKVRRQDMAWDAERKRLSVVLPPLAVTRPNLDEARAQYLREGVWITREAQDKLTRDNTRLAEIQVAQQAANPVLMNLARTAAKQAVTQNLTIPLRVAGYGDVTVAVRFAGEKEVP